MTLTPKVSIICPVYKAEDYICRCIDSVLAQTFPDFELILIDDGSPDRSGEICDQYANKDPRVRVIHQKNGGVSTARQTGMDNAQGEYIIHADPDDWIEPDMLEELYKKAKDDNADMVICDFLINYPDRQLYKAQCPSDLHYNTVAKEMFLHLHGSCCNKFVKKETCDKYNIRFDQDLSFCEDLYFNASLLKYPISISHLPKAFYHYDQTINVNSIVRRYSKSIFHSDEILYEKFCSLLKGTSSYKDAEAYLGYLLVYRAFHGNIFTSKEFYERCNKFIPNIKHKFRYTDKGISYYILMLSCSGLYRITYSLYNLLRSIKKSLK